MTARIFLKLFLTVLVIMAVTLTAIDMLSASLAERAHIDVLKRELAEKVRMLGALERSGQFKPVQQSVVDVARSAGGRVTVVAVNGQVLADSENDPALMENHRHRPEIQAALEGRIGDSTRLSATMNTRFLYVAGPISLGAIRIAMPLNEVQAQVGQIRRTLISYTALSFLPGVLIAAFFARYYSRKLGAIIGYASTLATGNFRARLANPGTDELGVLSRQLNETGAKLQLMFEELQREQVELERLERIRKDFVINVSHELRTPLASIQGYTETLLDGALNDADNNVRFLNIIRQNAERLARLTADLLTLSRIELKSQEFDLAAYAVSPILRECVDTLLPVAAKKSVELRLEAAPDGTEIFCDFEAMHQIMSNLLDNAIKYTPEGGRIDVAARRAPGPAGQAMVEISVHDSGPGIPAVELPRLFERFYRVDKARSRALGGTGLGLAIVKHLVRAQGGEVSVQSVLNQGSTFLFTVPVGERGLEKEAAVQGSVTE